MRRKEFLRLVAGGLAGVTLAGFSREMPDRSHDPVAGSLIKSDWKNSPETRQAESVGDSRGPEIPRYQELGKTGLRVSTVGFGVSRTMEPALVLAVMEAGINFMDTGRSYFRGQNEVMVGKVVGARRKEVVIQSKLRVNLTEEQLKSREDINRWRIHWWRACGH